MRIKSRGYSALLVAALFVPQAIGAQSELSVVSPETDDIHGEKVIEHTYTSEDGVHTTVVIVAVMSHEDMATEFGVDFFTSDSDANAMSGEGHLPTPPPPTGSTAANAPNVGDSVTFNLSMTDALGKHTRVTTYTRVATGLGDINWSVTSNQYTFQPDEGNVPPGSD